MASIRTRSRADGTTAHIVMWRHNGKLTQLTFDDPATAEQVRALVEASKTTPEAVAAALATRPADGPTVADVLEMHIRELTGIQGDTRARYGQQVADYICPGRADLRDLPRFPGLGRQQVAAVDKAAVADWLNWLDHDATTRDGRPLADKTIKNVHGLLSAALATAADKQLLSGPNPCRGLRLPRRDYGDDEMVCLTPQEWALLAGEIVEHWRPLFELLAGTGLRWGEAVALTVGHVNLLGDPPTVRVNQAQRRNAAGGQELGPTKTRRSRRTVTLPPQLVDVLVPLVTRPPGDRLFLSPWGNPAHGGLYGRVWRPAVLRAQDPQRHGPAALRKTPRIHDLRHSHASWLIAAGVDLLTVSRRLGHQDIQVTANTYGHLMPDQQRRAADAIAAVLAPPEGAGATRRAVP